MQHIDEDTLAMIALGEASDPTTAAHLQQCDQCRADEALLRRAVTGLRNADPLENSRFPAPPPHVWKGIAEQLGTAADIVASRPQTGNHPTAPDASPDRPAAPRAQGAGHGIPADATFLHDHSTTHPEHGRARLRRLPRSRLALAACATALGAALGTGVTWWAVGSHHATQQQASHQLQPILPAAAGYASLSNTHGERVLDITVKGLPETSGYFEVWLMDSSHTKLISIGTLAPDGHAVLPVPDNVSLSEYSTVDVSVQAYNGSPAHSGKSIVRGHYGS
ncbi:anti-sigma factor [Streptacidiphilus sp. PAMC 29251]